MRVRVTLPETLLGRSVDEIMAGPDAEAIVGQAKARVAKELGRKGLFLNVMPPLTFAQEVVRRYNAAHETRYAVPENCAEFLKLGQDLGYITLLPDES